MLEYLLTIRIPFLAMDDIEAREYARAAFSGHEQLMRAISQGTTKLQRIQQNSPPVGVPFKGEEEQKGP